ncbi:MAG: DNA polymerase III subunit delta [Candidatus Omnitrophica bacterium]|nr:DNA polymerase III subunit delta [Candidatus Omnitrophota bacterium]
MNYLVTGAEEYSKQEFINKLRKSLLGDEAQNSIDFEIFDRESRDSKSLANTLKTLPFSSKNRLVVIKNANELPQRSKEVILKYLNTPLKSTTVVMTSDAGKRDDFLTAVAKKTRSIRFEKPSGKELGNWIRNECAGHKKKISEDAREMLEECAGAGGLEALKNEIGKIASYAGGKEIIEAETVESVSCGVPLHSVFDLVDTVIAKKSGKALEYLNSLLLTEGKPYGILNGLAWQFRVLAKARSLGKGFASDKISRIIGVPERYARKTMEQASRFTMKRITESTEWILEADFSIKSGRFSVRESLETLLIKLCG